MKLLIALILLLGCDKKTESVSAWQDIMTTQKITFLTVNSASSYDNGRDGEPEGFDYELAKKFAEDYNLKIEFKLYDNVDSVLENLSIKQGHIAAAGITNTEKRRIFFDFAPKNLEVVQSVVCRKNHKVDSTKDLLELNFVVPAQSSYHETLIFLSTIYKDLKWEEDIDANSEVLLGRVWKSKDLCTIVDSNILHMHQRYMPELNLVFQFNNKDELAWAINTNNKELLFELKNWFKKKEVKNFITSLNQKYFEYVNFDSYNMKVFKMRIKSRLPKYIDIFKEASLENNIDWRLLAAVSYQESFWDPKAKSPTGVRGLMMLTRKTAKEVGVKNRIDPRQSIFGGARYLKKILKRVPPYVLEQDQIWFTLAAYNVGFYHLRDAMGLSIWQNLNPTKWTDIAETLPLLSQKTYYKKLPYGHARGLEPVIYVNRIKNYYNILKRQYR